MKKFLRNWQQFNEEIGLTLNDLDKPNKIGTRGDVLVKKIENGEEFEIEGSDKTPVFNKDIIDDIAINGEYSSDKAEKSIKNKNRYQSVFKDVNSGDVFRLNQITKTSEFGSTKGSSAGSIITRNQESIQAFLMAYVAQNETIPMSEDLSDILDIEKKSGKLSKYYYASSLICNDDVMKYYDTWIWTIENILPELNNPKDYEYHQIGSNSDLIKSIWETYRKSCYGTIGKVVHISKWNPADIWIVKSDTKDRIISLINSIDSLVILNKLIDRLFKSKLLMGLSLKKVSSRNTKKRILINGSAGKPRFKLKDSNAIDFNVNNKSINLYVEKYLEKPDGTLKYLSDDKVTITNNNSNFADINIEILSISSRQGKCNLEMINNFLDYEGIKTIPKNSTIRNPSIEDQEYVLQETVKRLDGKFRKLVLDIDKDLTESNLLCRIQALALCERLYNDPVKGNNVLNDFMLYALSIEWSMGRGEDPITCPMYYRVDEYKK